MRTAKNVSTKFVDTHFVLALVNTRDEHHAAVRAKAQTYLGQPLLTTEAILMEVGNGLARGFKAEAVAIIENFLEAENMTVVPVTSELLAEGFALYRKYEDKEWGLVDCISFVVMQREGIAEALTYDHHFAQAGFVALLRETIE
jgi:predicted nucleic acid-binding protein